MPALLAALLLFARTATAEQPAACTKLLRGVRKVDCGFFGVNEQQCLGKGCCWVPAKAGTNDPWCFHVPKPPKPHLTRRLTEDGAVNQASE